MATGNIIVNVVDVGQGQCTFIEIYNTDSTPKLVQTLLFDCGSDKRSDETDTNLSYIAGKVKAMDTPAFDCIFFSHSDSDHISLTARLLQLCLPTKPAIKKVVYGGNPDQYEKDGENILNTIVKDKYCAKDKIFSPKSNHSNYDPKQKKFVGTLWKSDDDTISVVSLASNILSSRTNWADNKDVPIRKTPVAKNMVSIVSGLYYGGASYIICGDATNGTMGAITKRIGATTVFNNNIMTTLPHHGSRTTGLSVSSARRAGVRAVAVVEAFAELLKSKTITVSAYALHNHPSLELMNMFIPTLPNPVLRDPRLVQRNTHYMTANIDVDLSYELPAVGRKRPKSYAVRTEVDTSFESRTNTFTSRYFDSSQPRFSYELGYSDAEESQGVKPDAGAINGFASWKYTAGSTGSASIAGYINLAAVSAFTQAPLSSSSAFISAGDNETSVAETLPAGIPHTLNPAPVRMPAMARPIYQKKLRQYN